MTIPGDSDNGVPHRGRRNSATNAPIDIQPTSVTSAGTSMQGSSRSMFAINPANFVAGLQNLSKVIPSVPSLVQTGGNNGSMVLYTPTCNADGSFQMEQCVPQNSRLRCFCINPVTGDPYAVRRYQSGSKKLLQKCPTGTVADCFLVNYISICSLFSSHAIGMSVATF